MASLIAICALFAVQALPVFAGSRIEADPSKEYRLTHHRGPWMIMVATMHSLDGETPEGGKTPDEAAHELVIELRQLGLPAYVHEYEPGNERVATYDRLGREESRKNLHRRRSVSVIAGNYPDVENKIAQDTLKWLKKLNPKCLQEGVIYEPTPGRPGPLAGAFLTPNPLLSQEELAQRERDPLLISLNGGERYSLYENKGKYTLVIARFYGKSVNVKAGEQVPDIESFFKGGNDLDNAAEAAQELAVVLRGKYDVSANGYFNNVEAYVWHDRHESIVTVGSFSSPQDPNIKRYMAIFGPRLDPQIGSVQPAHFAVPNFRRGGEHGMWLFEPQPEVMAVPRK
ncbi:MAG: hypothetical protein KDA88_00915 [Planctomycetaceae bacterium]|nr:hypothetical protein [Planctomycetaceae bacterium]MCB9952464.1 hypothetical protein [Planctomycetaceae bacterium]